MNVLKKIILGGCVAALTLGTSNRVMAQGRGNFDPAQFRQDRIDRAKDQLGITNDTDWKAIEPLVGKVVDARTEVMRMEMGGMFGRGNRRRSSDTSASSSNTDQQRQRRPNPFGEPSAAVTALRDALDAKAPTSEIKSKLAAVRAEAKEKESKLDAAQEELRGVLTSRQEAMAVVSGLLK
jgi:hypothetical protein